jgi:hypothetical protein
MLNSISDPHRETFFTRDLFVQNFMTCRSRGLVAIAIARYMRKSRFFAILTSLSTVAPPAGLGRATYSSSGNFFLNFEPLHSSLGARQVPKFLKGLNVSFGYGISFDVTLQCGTQIIVTVWRPLGSAHWA